MRNNYVYLKISNMIKLKVIIPFILNVLIIYIIKHKILLIEDFI